MITSRLDGTERSQDIEERVMSPQSLPLFVFSNRWLTYDKADPCFPLELFEEIACFVAGENHYGTLAALCATSKSMAEGLKGIMYETVVCNDRLLKRLRNGQADKERSEDLRHIKSVPVLARSHSSDSPWQIHHRRQVNLWLTGSIDRYSLPKH